MLATPKQAACRGAGLDDESPHVLRHACATWLMRRGAAETPRKGSVGIRAASTGLIETRNRLARELPG